MFKFKEKCPDPCQHQAHFQTEQTSCVSRDLDTCANPAASCRKNIQQKDYKVCQGQSELGAKVPLIKSEADKECLYNNFDECSCEDQGKGNEVQKDSQQATGTEGTSPLLTDTLPKDLTISEYKRADESQNPVCYMPQPEDNLPPKAENTMGPMGYWATGKVDWSPLGGLTGTRPLVDRYTISRFSSNEWRQNNRNTVYDAFNTFEESKKNDAMSKNTMIQTYANVDKAQAYSTKMIREKARLTNKYKQALERAISAMIEETSLLDEQKVRLLKAMSTLKAPQAIASECIERRACRPEKELVRDRPEEELVQELGLITEIESVFKKTLADITDQLIENRAAKGRMEYDWSDKMEAYETESLNCALNNTSTIVMFKPGATRLSENQSSEEYWCHFSNETLNSCEKARQRSIKLRGTLDGILLNSARDLRTQADIVERAFGVRINCMQENINRLDHELRECLKNIADTETRISNLIKGIQGMDCVMKVAQTRLDNRNKREHVENCRDAAQLTLIDEVRQLHTNSAMQAALSQAQQVKMKLLSTRADLERQLLFKRRTIMIDRDHCMLLRSQYPTTDSLAGK